MVGVAAEQYATLQRLFVAACYADIEAIKPGNVSLHAAGHGMHSADFIHSAEACAAPICAPHSTLGERIFNAVQATRKVVSMNTNLGIVLLAAPLIHAEWNIMRHAISDAAQHTTGQATPSTSHATRPATPHATRQTPWRAIPHVTVGADVTLRQCLASVLEDTTVADAGAVYRAIRLAAAGGLGRVERADISEQPTLSLLHAMRLAQQRDWIAALYASHYQYLFDEAIPRWLAFCSKWGYNRAAVSMLYMSLLAEHPDSLVIRKHGIEVAQAVRSSASALYEQYCRSDRLGSFDAALLELDSKLKHKGINPGTTADMTVATIFAASLEQQHSHDKEKFNEDRQSNGRRGSGQRQ